MYKLIMLSVEDDDLLLEKKFKTREDAEALQRIIEKYADKNKVRVVVIGKGE